MTGLGPNLSTSNGSRQPMFLVVTGLLLLLSTIAVGLRLYCRMFRIRNVGLDDWLMVVALCVTIAMGIMNAFHISWGTGRHIKDIHVPSMRIPNLKHFYFYQLVYPLALFFVKASILALYHRIFKLANFRWKVYAVAGFVSVYTIVVLFVNAFECRPKPSQAWSPTFPKGCNDLRTTYFAVGGINIFTDIMIFLLPLKAFWKLELAPRKRWALLGVFMVGGLSVIASIVRMYALWLYNTTKDISWDSIFILLLSQVEVNVAIISASAPTLRPLLKNTALALSQSDKYGDRYGSGYRNTIGSTPTTKNRNRNRASGQFELYSFGGRKGMTVQQSQVGGRSNTSEESILKDDGITKTTETTVDFEQVSQHNGKTGNKTHWNLDGSKFGV